MTADELHVKLTADTAQLTQQIDFAERNLKSFGTTSKRAADGAKASFEALKSTIATLGVGAMLKKVVTAAGELEQNIGGSSAVFGNFAQSLQQSASQAYRTMGLSQSEYLATANKMGALFQGSGFSIAQSVDMTTSAMQRAADVASIMGVDVGSAMEAVSGAAKGNFTMMDNLGVAINDTTLQIYAQEKGLGKLETTQQKVNAAMQMFLEKSDYAAGNYAKENETFAGSLQTFRAELQNAAAEVGTELLPVATQGIQILSTVLKEAAPVITDIVRGFGTLAQGMKLLENPAARGIAYAGLAVVAMNKLKAAVGGTAAGLMLLGGILSFVLGKYAQSQEEADKTISTGMDGASNAADKAAISTDGLTDSLNEANAAAARLAGFDEITKLSGGGSGSTIASKIATAEDIANIDSYSSAVDAYNDAIADINDNPFGSLSNIDWEELKSDLKALGDDIGLVFTGTETESFQALQRLRDRVKILFGEEFTDYWEGVGGDIYDVFHGTETESYQALYNLNERIKEIPFAETFQSIGAEFGKDIAKAVEATSLLAEGKYNEAMAIYSEVMLSKEKAAAERWGVAEPTANQSFWENATAYNKAMAEGDTEKALRYRDKIEKEVYDFFNDPFGGKKGIVVSEPSHVPQISYGNNGMTRNFNTGALNAPPMTAEDMMNIWLSRGGVNNNMTGPIQIYTTVELDGEKLGENQVNYQNNQIDVTNGR